MPAVVRFDEFRSLWISKNVSQCIAQLPVAPHVAVEELPSPKASATAEEAIDCPGRYPFNLLNGGPNFSFRFEFRQKVDMVGHDHPAEKPVCNAMVGDETCLQNLGEMGLAQNACAHSPVNP